MIEVIAGAPRQGRDQRAVAVDLHRVVDRRVEPLELHRIGGVGPMIGAGRHARGRLQRAARGVLEGEEVVLAPVGVRAHVAHPQVIRPRGAGEEIDARVAHARVGIVVRSEQPAARRQELDPRVGGAEGAAGFESVSGARGGLEREQIHVSGAEAGA